MQLQTKVIIILALLLSGILVVAPVSAAINWTYTFNTTSINNYSLVNSTYMKNWLPYLITCTSALWEFPVIGLAGSIMGPFTDAFTGLGGVGTGLIVYLIFFGIWCLMSWRQSGTIVIPTIVTCIVSGGIGLLLPPQYQPWIMLMLAAAVAANFLTFLVKE